MHITLLTGNQGKYEQIKAKMPEFVQLSQEKYDLPEIQTSLLTEISADKCQQAFTMLNSPVLVDDSGIYFEAFHDFPGALSKFLYEGIGINGIQRLYQGEDNIRAYFQCVLSYMDENMEKPMQFIGEIHGIVRFDQVGLLDENPKLPYDLIFQPDGMDCVALQDMERWKKQFNHRGKATESFALRLKNNHND